MKIEEKIKSEGEGLYKIIKKEIERFYGGMAGRDIITETEVEYVSEMFKTKNPSMLLLEAEATFQKDGYSVELECLERFYKMTEYNKEKNQTEEFELIIGVTEGYHHQNQKKTDIKKIYQEIAKHIFNETKVYVSAVIDENRVIYSREWGCPEDGEIVYTIKGTSNPKFAGLEEYKKAVEKLSQILATELKQKTFTLNWKKGELNYSFQG